MGEARAANGFSVYLVWQPSPVYCGQGGTVSKVEQDKVPASLGSLSHVLQPAILVPPGVIVPHLSVADVCVSAGGRTVPLVPPTL